MVPPAKSVGAPDPGTKLTTLDELIATARLLKPARKYVSRPERRYGSPTQKEAPDPMASLDGKDVTDLHLESDASVSSYDWYQWFSLTFEDDGTNTCGSFTTDESGAKVKEVRGRGRLSFAGSQKVFYTADVEEFTIATVEDNDDNDEGEDYTFNLRITAKPSNILSRWTKDNFGGYYDETEAEELKRTYDVRFNAFTGSWPNSNGYVEYDYTLKLVTDRSPYPAEAQEGLPRLPREVWETVFFSKVHEKGG